MNYNFKVKVSDYKKVIALVDTDIKGKLFSAGSHFITFDRKALPKEKIKLWFIPPETGNGETVTGRDNSCFDLGNLKSMKVSAETAERGYNYYAENEVVYLSLEGDKGYAIVEGTKPYEVEFKYRNGKISVLTCSCFCANKCKHEFATMLQLKERMQNIRDFFSREYEQSGYFSEIQKGKLLTFAVNGKTGKSIEFK